ncbi:dihydrofolate reductase [Opitutales bacterium]|nr:dihydrofolate reductase [Opitutales bacterium]
MIRMIAACARNRVMGSGGTLPWKIQKDWEHFLQSTRNDALVMGRRCYEDFVEYAQERKVVVLTRNPTLTFAYAQRAGNLAEGIKQASAMARNVWICGGEEIYGEAMSICEELHLTQIDADFEGDARFPDWGDHFPNEQSRRETTGNGYRLTFLVLQK